MPDTRRHRGAHPGDNRLFSPEAAPALRRAVADLCWLLDRGYANTSALKLVGDRYGLTRRQRTAVSRCACSEEDVQRREDRRLAPEDLAGNALWIDGYNVLTSIEAALAGGVILLARDGCFRDMASVHGTYRTVEETRPALQMVGEVTAGWGVKQCRWLLDSPVSNSGRLKGLLQQMAAEAGWNWQVELVVDPDAVLRDTEQVVATADSAVLDGCRRWVNLARRLINERIPQANLVDLWPSRSR